MSEASRKLARTCALTVSVSLALLDVPCVVSAQTSVGTGSIIGAISDPSGAVVSGADVTIANRATGQSIATETVVDINPAINPADRTSHAIPIGPHWMIMWRRRMPEQPRPESCF
jgi:hypothetical protein